MAEENKIDLGDEQGFRLALAAVLAHSSAQSLRLVAMNLGAKTLKKCHSRSGAIGRVGSSRSRRTSAKRAILRERLKVVLERSCLESRSFSLRELYQGIYTKEGFRKLLKDEAQTRDVLDVSLCKEVRPVFAKNLAKRIRHQSVLSTREIKIDHFLSCIFSCELLLGEGLNQVFE